MLKKAKVIYYLSDTSTFSQLELTTHIEKSNVKHVAKEKEKVERFVSCLPPGTIFAQSYDVEEKNNIICLPILSSHFSLPLKQGEFVWYMSDEISKKGRENNTDIFENHPLFVLNDYWLSRIHGTLISEDLNYSFRERDSIFLGKEADLEKLEEKNKDKVLIPSFESKNLFVPEVDSGQLTSTEDLYEKGLGNNFIGKPVPRMFSKTDDLTIQGSYNTLVNLTSLNSNFKDKSLREGLIDIVAGRLTLQNFLIKDEDDVLVKIGKKQIKNSSNLENSIPEKDFNLSLLKYIKIDNASGGKELFKKPNIYLNKEELTFNTVESKVNYDSDASRILVSESVDIDLGFFETEFLQKTQDYPEFLEEEADDEITLKKDYLSDTELKIINAPTIDISYFTTNDKNEIVSLPSILLKTNNIRIVARKELKNNEKSIPAGSIRLIKEDEKFTNYSQILMENDGNISIEGRSLKLGDFRKEFMKFYNIEDIEDIEDIDISNDNQMIKDMQGKGYGVLLGYNENLSEPLVLGNTLIAMLSETINRNVACLNEVIGVTDQQKADNQAIETFAKTVDVQLKGLGLPGAVLAFTSSANYDSIIEKAGKEIQKLENIKNNLKDILSKFSKTS